jgi:hypothetical protein
MCLYGTFKIQTVTETLSTKSNNKNFRLGPVASHYHPSYHRKPKTGGSQSIPGWVKSKTYLKNNQSKMAEDMVQMVQCLPSKHQTLYSNPSINP